MATYRLEAKIIGRSGDCNAVAAAAYRSGEQLVDRATGEVFDYTRRHGVFHTEIMGPDDAPPFASREDLWNAVQSAESRRDAQLAREFTLSLPHELNDEERLTLVRGFVRENFVSLGLVADVAIHRPDDRGDERNHHAHIMITTRPLTADGFGKKVRAINTREQLHVWRVSWERHVNRALERAHVRERVDHRSLRDRGIAREPEPKQGPFATEMERRGRRSNAGDDRRSVRRRNEEREKRRRAERTRSLPLAQLQTIVSAALEAVSPLITTLRSAAATKTRTGSVTHPAHDRGWEWQQQLLARQYGEAILASPLAQKWAIQRTETGLMFSHGKSRLEDAGKRISVNGDTAKDVAAILDLAQQKGWTAIKVEHGTAAFKVAVMTAALQRGLDVVAHGDDKRILAELRRLNEQRMRSPEQEKNTTARAAAPTDNARDVAGPGDNRPPTSTTNDVIVSEALELLTQQQSTFTRKDLERTLTRFSASPEHLAELLVVAQTSPEVEALGPDERGQERFTTGRLFAIEERLIAQSLEMANGHGFAVSERRRQQILEKSGLGGGQADAFLKATAANRYCAIVGLAGTGKSYAMEKVNAVYAPEGYPVCCGALAGVPTDSLARDAGIEDARTLAGWRAWLEAGNSFTDKTVFIGDEWGMVGSEDAAIITRALYDAGAKLIVLGDFLQLQPIAAGAAFRAVVERLPDANVARIEEVRRQKIEWMREATKLFGNGKPREALELYEKHGRFVASENREDAKHAIVAKWLENHLADPAESQIILAYTRADTLDINRQLRVIKREHGELTGPDVKYATSDGEREFSVNDRVFFTEPSKDLGVRNGTRAIVTDVDPEAKTLTVRIPEQDDRRLTVKIADYNAIDYSDCCTTHKAQGQTVDRAQFLATSHRGLAMYLSYVAMSRHREDAHLHWSKDQFKTIGQVYRVLCRLQPKDYSLDYSMQGARDGFGLGVPMQGATSIAMRATYQIRTELSHVLQTAAHLRDSAAAELRTQAQRAYGAVTSWFVRIDEQLRELESRGIRGVTIRGSAQGLHDRMSLLEQAVAQAADRAQALAREPARTLTRDDVAKRLHATRAALKTRLEEIRAQLRGAVEPLPTPDAAIASELQRLTATVAAAGTPAERAAAQTELDAMRERFARGDVRAAMQAAYNERAELVDVQKQQQKALRAERKDVEALLDRVNALDKRLETLGRDTLAMGVGVVGVQLVDALERDVGVEPPAPERPNENERDVSR